jgi:hypothetical protein
MLDPVPGDGRAVLATIYASHARRGLLIVRVGTPS